MMSQPAQEKCNSDKKTGRAAFNLLTPHSDQVAAALEGFFWPKVFWDFLTKNLDGADKPVPILQVLNLLFGLFSLAWEWPLKFLATTSLHRSIEARLVVYPIAALSAVLLYQATNPALYYLIGIGVYFWAYSEGEVCSLYCDLSRLQDMLIVLLDGLSCSLELTKQGTTGKGLIRAFVHWHGVSGISVLFQHSWLPV